MHKNAAPYACKYAPVMNPAFNGAAKRIWGHIVSFTQMNWAVCPLNRLPFFLSFFSSLPPTPHPHPAPPPPPCPSLLLVSSDVLPSDFSIEPPNIAPFHFRLHFRKTASCSRPVFVILFVSPHLCPIPHTPHSHPQPLSAWAQFLRLRLSHCQNGGKAQSVTIPQALRLRTKCLLFFFFYFLGIPVPPQPFHPFLRNPLMHCNSLAESHGFERAHTD